MSTKSVDIVEMDSRVKMTECVRKFLPTHPVTLTHREECTHTLVSAWDLLRACMRARDTARASAGA